VCCLSYFRFVSSRDFVLLFFFFINFVVLRVLDVVGAYAHLSLLPWEASDARGL
jgi:hypothetical protein